MFYIQVSQFPLKGNKKGMGIHPCIALKVVPAYIYIYMYPLFAQVYSRNRKIEHRTSIHTSLRGTLDQSPVPYVAQNPDPGERREKR
jgi:hypothetical protein